MNDSLKPLGNAVDERLDIFERDRFAERLWMKDASLWKGTAEIADRLGWLTLVPWMSERLGELTAFCREIRGEGFTHAVLLGMGGSSLCPEVLRVSFGESGGGLSLLVLDSTDPEEVSRVTQSIAHKKALILVASKSGGTAEVDALYRHFRNLIPDAAHFVAITDGGSPLEKLALETGFRRVFSNPSDIGGRYSALSYFGLVPAALMGLDTAGILGRAAAMAEACGAQVPARENPGLYLGAILAESVLAGLDKATLFLSPSLRAFGTWVEQLLAESTGKGGTGIVPVDGEKPGDASSYGPDRLFIEMRCAKEAPDRLVDALIESGQAVVRLTLKDRLDLGAEFLRWEIATAAAGAALGINPFDQPDVQESKARTKEAVSQYEKAGRFPEERACWSGNGVSVFADSAPEAHTCSSLEECLSIHLSRVRTHDYVAFLIYAAAWTGRVESVERLRERIRRAKRCATTVGYGPRYLHSTGQLHKGDSNRGVFVMVTAGKPQGPSIPGSALSFGTLQHAQALGDFAALKARGRRAIRVHLEQGWERNFETFEKAIEKAIPMSGE